MRPLLEQAGRISVDKEASSKGHTGETALCLLLAGPGPHDTQYRAMVNPL